MKIVIASVPYVDTIEPIMAPALLKAVLKSHGIESTAIDLNIEIVNILENHPRKQRLLDFFFSQTIHDDCVDDINYLINYSKEQLLKHNPDTVALSLLVYSCQIFTRWLCASIKDTNPNIKIVLGGTGTRNFIGDNNLNFCNQMKELRLINDYIIGDGEVSFVEYIKGNLNYPGINQITWNPIEDLNQGPWPDYSDYNFKQYKKVLVPLCDSRGCIKNCEFCDIIEHWKKFQYRSADSIWQEMLHQLATTRIRHFGFRSSLVNGNLREFKKLLELICEYNASVTVADQISWNGYFIIRSSNFHTEELWKNLGKSNGTLHLGVESLIPRIRTGLGKPFDDIDLDYTLEMGQKYNVPLELLLIIAYPTETLADYEYTKQWFINNKRFANNSVFQVNLSFASILPGTELARKSKDYNIKRGKLPSIWINQNLQITSEMRIAYLKELETICRDQAGFVTATSEQTIEHTSDNELY